MSAAKHTLGPLRARGPSPPVPDTPEGGDFAIVDAQGEIIGEAFRRSSPTHLHPAAENARLWAAAPTMLEALVEAAGALQGAAECMRKVDAPKTAEKLEEIALAAMLVIAKATGNAA